MDEGADMHDSPAAFAPLAFISVAMLFLGWMNRSFDYECSQCGSRFSLSFWQAALSPHMMGRKLVRCHECGNWGWATAVRK